MDMRRTILRQRTGAKKKRATMGALSDIRFV